MVCDQRETAAIDVLVELATTVDQQQSFLFQLSIVSLAWLQGPRSVCHRVLCPIWQDMGEDSSNSVTGYLSCKTNGQFGIVMYQHWTGTQLMLRCLKYILTRLVPLPGLTCFQQSIEGVHKCGGIEGMHKCGPIEDKLPIVLDHLQEGTELTRIAWCRGPLDGINFG